MSAATQNVNGELGHLLASSIKGGLVRAYQHFERRVARRQSCGWPATVTDKNRPAACWYGRMSLA